MAERVAVITDSNSGITQRQAEEMGIFVVPMPFNIDGNTYFEDISLTQDEFYRMLEQDADISTSQPAAGDILNLWERLLQTHDTLLYIPMSSGLSGSCATALALADDYAQRVFVTDNQRISVTQRQAVTDAAGLARQGKSAREIYDILMRDKLESSIYIMLDTMKYLKKGGRVTPAAAAIATVLKIKPVLQIQGKKLDAYARARSEKLARGIMIDALRKDIDTRFGGIDNVHVFMAHTHNGQNAAAFAQEVRAALGVNDIYIDPLSLSVACHIGPGSLAVACAVKTPELL